MLLFKFAQTTLNQILTTVWLASLLNLQHIETHSALSYMSTTCMKQWKRTHTSDRNTLEEIRITCRSIQPIFQYQQLIWKQCNLKEHYSAFWQKHLVKFWTFYKMYWFYCNFCQRTVPSTSFIQFVVRLAAINFIGDLKPNTQCQ